jgi:hypothetical protein
VPLEFVTAVTPPAPSSPPVTVKSTPACGWSPGPSAACLRVLEMRIAPLCRASWNVHVTVSPADSMIAPGGLPPLQVLDTKFQPAGTVSATSPVRGIRAPGL